MPSEIKLPKLKENVDSVEVNEVLVQPGQTVQKDQPLLVVNADKSNMEVYAPMAGKVVKLNVKVGDEIKVGSVTSFSKAATARPRRRRSRRKRRRRASRSRSRSRRRRKSRPSAAR
jgi:dihydrolipoamide dehydrogenase